MNSTTTLSVTKSILNDQTIAQLEDLFPEQKSEDILTAIQMLFFLRLADQKSGTLRFVSAELPLKIKGFEDFSIHGYL